MKKGLLAGTAIVGAVAAIGGAAVAAEAPTWKLSGNMNFQFYWVDQDNSSLKGAGGSVLLPPASGTLLKVEALGYETTAVGRQEHDWYFGVDEAELALNVDGATDNGLKYGFKIEIQVNTDDGTVADEARIELSGSWGTLQLGDEDGAEDIMNFGGENLMGATGGFDGDQDDYLILCTPDGDECVGSRIAAAFTFPGPPIYMHFSNVAAPSYPTIAGDSGDATKISYYSPRFSGFQVGASITPTPNEGDGFKEDGDWENHYGLGANYDNSFGSLRIRASAVYSAASVIQTAEPIIPGPPPIPFEDVSAWSVGGIVGWGPFSIGGNYTDNGDSGRMKAVDYDAAEFVDSRVESSYWNVAAAFETGPMKFAAGYFSGITEAPYFGDSTYEHIALTADYTMAPGLGVYAEINVIDISLYEGLVEAVQWDAGEDISPWATNSATSLVIGVNVSF